MIDTLIPFVLPFDSPQAVLEAVGGKGANLGRLWRAGLPVPGGFFVTTRAYAEFVRLNGLDEHIEAELSRCDTADPAQLEATSGVIRELFEAGRMPEAVREAIRGELQALGIKAAGGKAVAVRSSATAEDLPELSFAGQQDTYLNVVGEAEVLRAVVRCWGSLWTARAMGYRARGKGVGEKGAKGLALGVVVQEMVAPSAGTQALAAGVMFTANPVTGLRGECVIEATVGLGEALVSGLVEPDRFQVDTVSGLILSKKLGAKRLAIVGLDGGGTQQVEAERSGEQALPDQVVVELGRLGQEVQRLYAGVPQDIEFAWSGEKLYLLQARPVTSLFPTPPGMPAEPLKVMFSLAAVQGLFDPLTPVGRSTLALFFATASNLFGSEVTEETQQVLFTAGERFWVNFTPVLRNSIGQKLVPVVLGMVEPTVGQAVEAIKDDPRLQPERRGIRLRTVLRMGRFFGPLALNLILNMISPAKRRRMIVGRGEWILQELEWRAKAAAEALQNRDQDLWAEGSGQRNTDLNGSEKGSGEKRIADEMVLRQRLGRQVELLPGLCREELPRMFVLFVSAVAAGMASWNWLGIVARGGQGQTVQRRVKDLVLEVTRGMPYNPTTEMDLALWELAKSLREVPGVRKLLVGAEAGRRAPQELGRRYLAGELPEAVMSGVEGFLRRYGGRGLAEIDLGRPRWADDPTHVFEMLGSFVQIEAEDRAPDVVFGRGAAAAERALAELTAIVGKTRRGWIRRRLVRFFGGRARQLMGVRESPKFFVVRMMAVVRRELLKTGEEFARLGVLNQGDDLFFLTWSELRVFALSEPRDWRGLIAERRAVYEREQLRRQVPRLLLSDGRAFYEGMSALGKAPGEKEDGIWGSPVSQGVVEAPVRVVQDPRKAGLLPGEVLVCAGTDPSWTPLFLSAGGLVMETGGMMTHGAVVAREYGIPAVVGVDQATVRLVTGMRVRLNGSTGEVVILEEDGKMG